MRKYYLDNLRCLTVALVVVYHVIYMQRQIDVYRAVVVNEDAEPLPLTQQEAGIAQQKTGLSRAEKARDQIDRDHPQLKRTTRWAKR